MQQLKRVLKWGLALAVVATLVWVGRGALRGRSGESQAAGFTQVLTVERGDLVAAISPTGEVYAARQAKLSFDVNKIPLVELYVTPGQQVQEGEVLARIDPASLERAVEQAKADLLSAEEALEKAQNPYTELDRQKAELDVTQAEVAVEEAKQALEELLNPDLATAEKAVRDADRELRQARDKLAALQSDPSTQEQIDRLQWQANEAEVEHGQLLDDPSPTEAGRDSQLLAHNRMLDTRDKLEAAKARAALDLLSAQNKVIQAEEALADAEERLTELQAGPDALALAQGHNKVAQAEYNLAKARDDLATIRSGPDPEAVELAQARYDARGATFKEAQDALEAATMVAPFDGTVISVGPEVGDLISSNTNVVTLADLSDLEVLGMVDETDISQVEVGQQAEITFDAFPGRRFWGEVLEVPLEGRLMQNVVSYEVPVSLEGAEGVSLRPGMTANLRIVVGRRENALLVSVLAVQQGEEGSVVQVQDTPQGPATATRVEVGLSDGLYVEVVRGLNEGDRVVVEYQSQEEPGVFGGFGTMMRGIRRMGRP
jgi:HlyD family secretion protein